MLDAPFAQVPCPIYTFTAIKSVYQRCLTFKDDPYQKLLTKVSAGAEK